MTPKRVEALDTTYHKTHEWLNEISAELENDNPRYAYLALRGTLHAIRDFLPLEESAQLSAQLPMLVRGIYFEGWDPSRTPERERTRDRFLGYVVAEMERALWNEEDPIEPEAAMQAALRVLSRRVSAGEIAQVRRVLPEKVRALWPETAVTA